VMDGWTFLSEYGKLPSEKRESIVVVMLTSSVNPDDEYQANTQNVVSAYVNKYLDETKLTEIFDKTID